MKGIVKLIAITALAGMVITTVVSATEAKDTGSINYAAFEEDDPMNIAAPKILEKMAAEEYKGSTGTLKYRIYKSPAYKTKDASTPALMLVFLHGSGGSGDDNEQQIKDQKTTVNYLVCDLADELFKDIPYVVIAPQCPTTNQWVEKPYAGGSYDQDEAPISGPMQLVYELVCDMQKNEGITAENTVIGGISMGGYGTWDLSLRHPELFGSIIPICGAGDPEIAERIKDKRIWVFHSDNDTAVPVSGSRDMVEALRALGAENLTYTEFEGRGHNAWTPAMTEVKDPYLLQWIFDGIRYTVTTELEGEGEISKSVTGVKGGDSVKIEFSPAEGYVPGKVLVDGVEVNPTVPQDGAMYITLENVNKNHSVKAVFEKAAEEESSVAEVTGGKNKLSKGALAAIIGGAAVAIAAAVGVVLFKSKKKKK